MSRRWTETGLVLGAFTLLTLVLTYPLPLHLGDTIPGVQGDVWSYVWAMGWARTSLDLGVNPFRTDYVYYPLGGATQLLWATALPSFASLPLQLAFGLIPAFNVMYLAATVLTAYGTYLLAKYVLTGNGGQGDWGQGTKDGGRMSAFSPPTPPHSHTPNRTPNAGPGAECPTMARGMCHGSQGILFLPVPGHPTQYRARPRTPDAVPGASPDTRRSTGRVPLLSSFVAGLAFAFCALRLGYGLAFTNLYHTDLIPFYILFLLKTGDERSWRNPILAGVLLGLNAYIDFQIAAFLALFTGLWFVVTWLTRRSFRALLSRAATVACIAGLVALPMLAVVTQDLMAEGGNYIRVYPLKYSAARSYDLLAYVLPNARSSFYQLLPTPRVAGVNAAVNVDGESQLSPDRQSFLGLAVLALAVAGAFKRPRNLALWIAAAVFFVLLSFGPTLHVAGMDLSIPLPYALLHDLPIANHIRIPMRYGIMTFLSMAVLAGAGVNWLASRFHPAAVFGLAALVILGEAVVLPYPTLPFSVPAIYNTIAAQPGDFTVLEIPTFNWRAAAQAEVFQTFDQKRILRAYTNRIAPDVADYFGQRQTPFVVRSLRLLEGAEDGVLSPQDQAQDRNIASAVIRFFNLRYAVLHREWFAAPDAQRIDHYLTFVLGARKVYDEGTVAAYEFADPGPAPADLALDLSSDAVLMYLGRGWQTEPQADLENEQGRYMTGDASELYFNVPAHTLALRVFSENAGNVLQCELAGRVVGTLKLEAGWADYQLSLPAELANSNLNTLRLAHPPPQVNHIAVSSIEIH